MRGASHLGLLRHRHHDVLQRSPATALPSKYGEHVAEITIDALELIDGWLPPRALRLVLDWAGEHRPSCARTGTALVPTSNWSGSIRCPSICPMVAVTAVEPLADYTLRLTFDDGSERVVDLADELWARWGAAPDPAYFRKVRVDPELRTIVWPNGST